MELPEELKGKSLDEIEEWFLNALSSDSPPVGEMLNVLASVGESGNRYSAEGWSELLQDALREGSDKENSLRLLSLRASWSKEDPEFRPICRKAAADAFDSRLGTAFVESVGFKDGVPLEECLRRLRVLMDLTDGRFCLDKTWGFGIVRNVDDFYKKVTIDFDGRPGHQMSFGYAAESLELIGDDHILSMKRKDPDGLAELVKGSPGEVVKMAIRNYGEMSAPLLKEILADQIFPESDWKKFWDGARKSLKADPLVELPSKRNDPIRLLSAEKEYGSAWFASLASERDTKRILELAWELEGEADSSELDDESRRILAERLSFVLLAARGRQFDVLAEAVMTAQRFGLKGDLLDTGEADESLLSPDGFAAAVSSMPARDIRPFISYLDGLDRDRAADTLLASLASVPFNVLNESVAFLRSVGKEAECAEAVREFVASGGVMGIAYWLCRNLDEAEAWSGGGLVDVLAYAIDLLGVPASGESLKTQKSLRSLFEQKGWFEGLLEKITGRHREMLLRQINDGRGWDASGKRSVMARMIRSYPELEETLASAVGDSEPPKGRDPVTSWRSYHARQEHLRKLVEEDIPRNSRDIGVARSYGDLRENFEYQAAKDQQSLLMRRKKELEDSLEQVKGTDFSEPVTETAGIGTCVTLVDGEGVEKRYSILGEWDGDEALGIISCQSRLAEAVIGLSRGATATVAGETGPQEYRIQAVSPLPDDVKEWISG